MGRRRKRQNVMAVYLVNRISLYEVSIGNTRVPIGNSFAARDTLDILLLTYMLTYLLLPRIASEPQAHRITR